MDLKDKCLITLDGRRHFPQPKRGKPGVYNVMIGDYRYELVPTDFAGYKTKHVRFTAFRGDDALAIYELPGYQPQAKYIYDPYRENTYVYVRDLMDGLYEYRSCSDANYTLPVTHTGFVAGDSQSRVFTVPIGLILPLIEYIKTINETSSRVVARLYRDDWLPFLHKNGYVRYRGYYYETKRMCELRTNDRLSNGTYFEVPRKFPKHYGTGVHMSTLDDKLLAYYPTDRHIIDDLPQRIKPGRYLKKYFPELSDDEVRVMSAQIGNTQLKYYTSGEDMRKQYLALSSSGIVSSCMSKDQWPIHPLMVYDNSDVELAVLESNGEPIARALYNKHTREYPMVYGQWERMKVAMDKAGFKHGVLDGALINVIPYRSGYLMPYIDGHRNLNRSVNNSTMVEPDYENLKWRITANGVFTANAHDSATVARDWTFKGVPRDTNTGTYQCDDCGEMFEEHQVTWIDYEEVYVCHDHDPDNYVYVTGNRHAQSCLSTDNFIMIDGEWYESDDAAEYHGWRYSHYEGCWFAEADVVWSSNLSDYLNMGNEGTQWVWIDDDVWLIKEVDVGELYMADFNSFDEPRNISFTYNDQPLITYINDGRAKPPYVHESTWRALTDLVAYERQHSNIVAA